MAQYTCTAEYDMESDEIRLFQAEVASYGNREGHDPDGWEVVSDVVETNEAGDSRVLHHRDPLYKHVEALLLEDALKQWDEQEPDFGSDGYPYG